MNNLILQLAKRMNQKSSPQVIAPPKMQEPSLPVESVTLALEETLEAAPATTQAPYEILERSEDGHYAQHWGINE